MKPFFRLMRLHQPVGIWLLLWPCWWSLALASNGLPPLKLMALYALGAIVMRSAGCIVNDIADRNFDRQVERTSTRPLASGEISLPQALALLAILLSSGAAIAYSLGLTTFLWALASLPLVVSYPFMKRISWWPQLFLGFTFNWGALMAWATLRGHPEWPSILLYIGGICWTLGYDTIYAHQDKKDDAKIGVKSTALRLGSKTKLALALFYGLSAASWALAGVFSPITIWYYFCLLLTITHFVWQIRAVTLDNPTSCRRFFLSNMTLGGIVFFACVAGKISL